ncbi:dihydrodiol dehydrogenase [Sulfolobus acidocaldarius SUSAZ]|nr:dihydrodiol dehydrogenase [Sulfolobus acidocaldarius SUSAZ]
MEIKNEYAFVLIRLVSTGNGIRLEIYSPNFGTKIYLDPLQLESLTIADEKDFETLINVLYNGRKHTDGDRDQYP